MGNRGVINKNLLNGMIYEPYACCIGAEVSNLIKLPVQADIKLVIDDLVLNDRRWTDNSYRSIMVSMYNGLDLFYSDTRLRPV